MYIKEESRRLALDGWQLLSSMWIEDHLDGLRLEAKELDPEEYAKIEKEITEDE